MTDQSQAITETQQERRQLTVVFCDLVDSSSLALNIDPEEFSVILHGYQKLTTDIVNRYNGHVARYVGDGVLIYFGYPLADETDATRAILCSLELLRCIPSISSSQSEGLSLQARIGIATGQVVIGVEDPSFSSISSLAIGNVPYIAARLQQAGKPGSLYIASSTYHITQGRFLFGPAESLAVKGQQSKLEIFEVTGVRNASHRFFELTDHQDFLGRQDEVAHISSILEHTPSGWSKIAIRGEPGIGKSALAVVVLGGAETFLDRRVDLHCSKIYTHHAYYPIIQFLRQRILVQQPDISRDSISAFLFSLKIKAPSSAEPLQRLLCISEGMMAADSPDPFSAGEEFHQMLYQILFKLITGDPRGAILLDDAQWVDESTLGILDELLKTEVPGLPVMLVTQRSGLDSEFIHLHDFECVDLLALEDRYILEIVSIIDQKHVIPVDMGMEICEKAGGNPLFAEELSKNVLSHLLIDQGRPDKLSPLGVNTPVTLQDLIISRLDRLDDSKPVAQIASIIDRTIHLDVLAEVIARIRPAMNIHATLQVHVRRLMDNQIIVPLVHDENCFKFKHTLIQDTISRSLLLATRKQYSETLGDFFCSTSNDQNLYLSYHHFMQAENIEKSITVLLPLVDMMIQKGAFRESMHLVESGMLKLDSQLEAPWYPGLKLQLLLRLGYICMATFGYGSLKCKNIFEQTLALSRDLEHLEGQFRSIWGLARFSMMNSGLALGKQYAGELVKIAEQQNSDSMRLESNLTIGVANLWLGNFDQALSNYNAAHALLSDSSERNMYLLYGEDPKVLCLSRKSFPLWATGQTHQALLECESAVMHAEELDHSMSRIRAYTFKAWLHQFRYEVPEAMELAYKIIQMSSEFGHAFWQTCGQLIHAWGVAHSSSLEQGIDLFEVALKKARKTGTLGKTYQNAQLAELYFQAGDMENAHRALTRAEKRAESSGDGFWKSELLRQRGVMLATEKQTHFEGLNLIMAAIDRAKDASAHSLELRAYLSLLNCQKDETIRFGILPKLKACLEHIQPNPDNREYQAALRWLA